MSNIRILHRTFLAFLLLGFIVLSPLAAQAADLPTAAGSPIAGISFDDRPLMLPVQRNFQMAMLTASSELGRSCGRMEAYGWRMANDEQQRVNQLFNNTVDRLRAQGFVVEAKTSNAVSRDVTLFAADRPDKHLIFLWSAGEIGLVMVLCETSAPLSPIPEHVLRNAEGTQPATMPSHTPMATTSRAAQTSMLPTQQQTSSKSASGKPVQLTTRAGRPAHENFSPVGDWSGTYTCAQGTTGATLQITSLKGDQFEGVFQFYPTAKNPYVPTGKYRVFGEYDRDSQRILVNPGKWIQRPKDFYSTIMIGSFDPVNKTFSGYFQGITGCTSFEASTDGPSVQSIVARATAAKGKALPPVKKAKPVKAKKVVKAKKDNSKAVEPVLIEGTAPKSEAPKTEADKARASSIEPPAGIRVGEPAAPAAPGAPTPLTPNP